MKRFLALALTIVLALSVSSFSVAEETPTVGGDLVVALSYEPDTLNVYSTHLMGDVQAAIVEGLLVPGPDMEYQPVLAKEVPTVDNGLIVLNDDGTMDITYHLQENVLWHDGEKLTSADVKATWEALYNEAWDAESKDGVYDVDSIDTPDDYTVVCHYNVQTPDFAQTLFTFGIMPKHIIDGVDMNDENNGYNRCPIGTGPYKFVEWVSGEDIKLARNENYWREGAYIDTITIKFVSDENTRINMLKSGEVDFAYGIGFTNYNQVSDIAGTQVYIQPMNAWRYFDFNQNIPGLDDVNVRHAIACAIDKQGLVDQLFNGIPIAWDQPWMSSDPFHVDGFKTEWQFDLTRAAQILDDAGYVTGADGVREKDGVRLEFTIGCKTGSSIDELIEQVVMQYLGQIGIKINIENYAASTWNSMMYAGEYNLAVGGYITSPGATRTVMYANKDNGGLLNRGNWVCDEFTALCDKIDHELDEGKRKEYVAEALTYFDEGLPQIVLFNNTEVIVASTALKGFTPNPTNMTHFCQCYTWYMAQ